MKCTELVIRDHVIIRRALDILDGMVRKLESNQRIEISDVTAILKFLRLFADEYHQTLEEEVLFPALLKAAPDESRLRHIVWEHGEERRAMACIDDALRSKVGKDFVRNTRRLCHLLRNHFTKEERVLCDVAEQCLSPDQDNAIAAEFERNWKQPEFYTNLSRLEWKYTGRVAPAAIVASAS
jgi:hemerythrin-like domain-containing protein